MSALGQLRTHAGGKEVLFDHLVCLGQQHRRHIDAECLGSLEIDNQFKLGRLLDRQLGGLVPLRILSA